jgi:hypothetical protein
MPTTMPTTVLLPLPIGFPLFGMEMQTLMAGLRRVSRVHQDQLDSRNQGFVRRELSELIERPTMVLSALGFPDFGALPN